jgi:hypothetical protein
MSWIAAAKNLKLREPTKTLGFKQLQRILRSFAVLRRSALRATQLRRLRMTIYPP